MDVLLAAEHLDEAHVGDQSRGTPGHREIFRAHPDEHLAALVGGDAGGDLGGQVQSLRAEHHRGRRPSFQARLVQVHRGGADERGHEDVGRPLVERSRRAVLLQDAALQHRHPVAHRHRLGLVVRDVQRRGLNRPVHPQYLRAHLHPELGVQVG